MKSQQKQLNQLLLESVIMSDINQAKLLIEQGANVNTRDLEHNEIPLILAIKFADPAMVQLLPEAGAEIDLRDDKGRTALFYAPVSSEKFKVLLSAKADIQARDAEGNTILMKKIDEAASLAEVNKLLQLGIDPKLQNENKETALFKAERLGLEKIAERLREVIN